jgi:DNA-binding response OmpR family regulator
LLLDSDRSTLVDVDLLRANGLLVYHRHDPANALNDFQEIAPDVVVAALSPDDAPSIVSALRRLAGYATSIIARSVVETRDAVHQAGADSFLPVAASPAELLHEIHRALILRRSGRRLPWNW